MANNDWEKFDSKKINTIFRKKQFELGATLPRSWAYIALNLKWGADTLFDCYFESTTRWINKLLEDANEKRITNGSRELTEEEQVLVNDGSLISIYLMLMGFSIENLLKAIIMRDHPEFYVEDKKLKIINHHRLYELSQYCNIHVTSNEKRILKELAIYSEWKGRYPVPLSADNMPDTLNSDGTAKGRIDDFHGRKTQEVIEALFMKIWRVMEDCDFRSTQESNG